MEYSSKYESSLSDLMYNSPFLTSRIPSAPPTQVVIRHSFPFMVSAILCSKSSRSTPYIAFSCKKLSMTFVISFVNYICCLLFVILHMFFSHLYLIFCNCIFPVSYGTNLVYFLCNAFYLLRRNTRSVFKSSTYC